MHWYVKCGLGFKILPSDWRTKFQCRLSVTLALHVRVCHVSSSLNCNYLNRVITSSWIGDCLFYVNHRLKPHFCVFLLRKKKEKLYFVCETRCSVHTVSRLSNVARSSLYTASCCLPFTQQCFLNNVWIINACTNLNLFYGKHVKFSLSAVRRIWRWQTTYRCQRYSSWFCTNLRSAVPLLYTAQWFASLKTG